MAQPTTQTHRITWWVWAGNEKIRHEASMRGAWGYDVTCSCGWESRTGGGVLRYVRGLVKDHKFDVAHGFWPREEEVA